MSDDKEGGLFVNPLPFVMLILLAAGVLVKNVPLESARPVDAQSVKFVPSGDENVEARLWQDPFAAVEKHKELAASSLVRDSSKTSVKKMQLHTPQALHPRIGELYGNNLTIVAVSIFGGTFGEAAEWRRRWRLAVVSALGFHEYNPRRENAIGYFDLRSNSADFELTVPYEWFEGYGKSANKNVLVLWLNEDEFTTEPLKKLRMLSSRLIPAPFRSLRIKLIGPAGSTMLAELVRASRMEAGGPSNKGSVRNCGLLVPRPWNCFEDDRKELIEPAGSTMLAELVRASQMRAGHASHKDSVEKAGMFEVFVSGATISDCDLLEAVSKQIISRTWDCFKGGAKDLSTETVRIVRTTGTDDVLAAALQWELWQRGVNREFVYKDEPQRKGGIPSENLVQPWERKLSAKDSQTQGALQSVSGNEDKPQQMERNPSAVVTSRCKDGLVLISEHDTEYGRALSRHLSNGFTARCRTSLEQSAPVRTFTYLRGLDGVLPRMNRPKKDEEVRKDSDDKDEKNKSLDLRAQIEDTPREHAEGRGQFDYLRRLADEIDRLDNNKRFAENGIKAIGIVGSDVYDKLLILQALAGRFKNKVFFTTDLDARFLHPDQKTWTRNLVVASNFGLTLDPALQGTTLPFRDSYQTAIYFSTLVALASPPLYTSMTSETEAVAPSFNGWADKMKDWIRPQIFEIGRTEAVFLASPTVPDLVNWIKGGNLEDIRRKEIECDKNNSPSSNGLSECANIHSAHPLHGISPEYLRNIISIILFGILCFLTHRKVRAIVLRKNSSSYAAVREVTIAVLGVIMLAVIVPVTILVLSWKDALFEQSIGEPFLWLEGVSVWPSLILYFVGLVLMLVLMFVFTISLRVRAENISKHFEFDPPQRSRNKRDWKDVPEHFEPDPPEEWLLRRNADGDMNDIPKYLEPPSPKQPTFARNWRSAIWNGPHISLDSWSEKTGKQEDRITTSALWWEYLNITTWREMWRWILACILSVSFLFLIVSKIMDMPSFPSRGQFVEMLYMGVAWCNLFALLLVIFWVGYETTACACFIDAQSKTHHDWPQRLLDHETGKTGVPDKYLVDYLNFRLAVRVSERISWLIYLPFIGILFMVLARNNLFDAMDFPGILVFATGLALAYALYTVRILRKSATRERDRALKFYEKLLLRQSGIQQQDSRSISTEQIKLLMERIRNTRRGIFVPFTQQPWLQAVLLPFGGYGGAQLIEYLIGF